MTSAKTSDSALRLIGVTIDSSRSDRSMRSRCRVRSMIAPSRTLAGLVDRIGELIAAILDVHGGAIMRDVAAVHIRNTANAMWVHVKTFENGAKQR